MVIADSAGVVDIAAMRDVRHENDQTVVLGRTDDSILAQEDAPRVVHRLEASLRPPGWIDAEQFDGPDDAKAVRLPNWASDLATEVEISSE